MKKLLLLALTSAALASLASAATYAVACGNASVNDGNGTSANIVCPAFNNLSTPGGTGVYVSTSLSTLSSVTQILDGQGQPINGGATMTYSSAGFAFLPLTSDPTTSSNVFGTGGPAVGPGDGGTFVVTFSSTATPGTVGQATGSVAVVYTYDVPTQGVPEPATLSLVGGALIGLGVIARRRR